jgi:hypothetical protein
MESDPRPSALRARRLLLGISQPDLAAMAGVSIQLVSALELGDRAGLGPGARRVFTAVGMEPPSPTLSAPANPRGRGSRNER